MGKYLINYSITEKGSLTDWRHYTWDTFASSKEEALKRFESFARALCGYSVRVLRVSIEVDFGAWDVQRNEFTQGVRKMVKDYVSSVLRSKIATYSMYIVGDCYTDDMIEHSIKLQELSANLQDHLEGLYKRPCHKLACDFVELCWELDPFGFCLESYTEVKDLEQEITQGIPKCVLDMREEVDDETRPELEALIKRMFEVER